MYFPTIQSAGDTFIIWKNLVEVIYFINILLLLGFVWLLLSSRQRELNGKLFIAWYFETCNSLPSLFKASYNPKGQVLRFIDRRKKKKPDCHPQKSHILHLIQILLWWKGRNVNNSLLRFYYYVEWSCHLK